MKRFSAFFFTYLLVALPVHGTEIDRRNFLKLGAAASVTPVTPAIAVTPIVPAAPAIAVTTAAVAAPAVDMSIATLLAETRRFGSVARLLPNFDGIDHDDAQEMRTAYRFFEEEYEVVRDWAENNPAVDETLRAQLEIYFKNIEAVRAGMANGTYRFAEFLKDSAAKNAIEHARKTVRIFIAQEPWASLDWREVFGPRLVAAEMELATEIGLPFAKVAQTVELLKINHADTLRSLTLFMAERRWMPVPEDFIYSKEFAHRYIQKIEKTSRLYARLVTMNLRLPRSGPYSKNDVELLIGLNPKDYREDWQKVFTYRIPSFWPDLAKSDQDMSQEVARFFIASLDKVAKTKQMYLYIMGEQADANLLRHFDHITKTLRHELATLPQRIQFVRQLLAEPKIRPTEQEGLAAQRPVVPSADRLNLPFSPDALQLTDWLGKIQSLGYGLGTLEQIQREIATNAEQTIEEGIEDCAAQLSVPLIEQKTAVPVDFEADTKIPVVEGEKEEN